MIIVLSIIHYVLLAILFWQAFRLLKRLKGNSILAIYALAVLSQGGLFWAYYLFKFDTVDMPLSEASLIRMIVSLCLASAVFIVAIVTFQMRMPRMRPAPLDNIRIPEQLIPIIGIAGIIFGVALIASPATRLVLEHGSDVIGSEGYYQLRGELIQVQTESARGRLMTRFMTITYGVMLLGTFAYLYKFAIHRRTRHLMVAGLFALAPAAQAILSFQKTPVVMLGGGVLLIFLLFRRHGEKIRIRLGGAILAIVMVGVLGLLSNVVFQGMRITEAGEAAFNRVFVVPINTGVAHCEVYPDYNPYVKFADVGFVRQFIILGHVPMYGSMAREVALTLRGADFNANTGLIGNGWGTWGYLGVVMLSSFMAGFFFLIDRFTNNRRHLVSLAPLVVYYWFFFIIYGNGNFHNVLATTSLWLIPFLYFKLFGANGAPVLRPLPDPRAVRVRHSV